MEYNEKAVIERCHSGDTQAFGLLYDRHVKTIYNFIYYKTFHKETAEDLTSETFFKALKNIQSVDSNRSFISWLYKVAQNTVLDHFRTRRKSEDIDDFWDIKDETDIAAEAHIAGNIEELKKHLKTLPTHERDLILMRVWQDMSYKEIAEVLGKSEASCKMMYSRTIAKLRDMMPLAIFLLLVTKL
jgi:RNA polymerase sigma-70 factor (ECF subfamily)